MYWDFPLCTMILCLLPGYQKKMELTQPQRPCGFYLFSAAQSFHLFTDFKPDTIRGSTSKTLKPQLPSESEDPLDLPERGCSGSSSFIWFARVPPCDTDLLPEKVTGMSSSRHSSNSLEEMVTAVMPFCPQLWVHYGIFQKILPRFPQERVIGNPLQQTTREHKPANGTGTKARTKATANPGSSSRLPTKVLWCYSETGFVCFCPT